MGSPPAAASPRSPSVLVLMGVAGSGKTTIGQKLAHDLGWPFRDADEFHTAANIAKMASGTPLTDDDRAPWLAAVRAYIADTLAAGGHAIVTCSALRERYRRALTEGLGGIAFVHLAGDFDLIQRRISDRTGHFMKPEMLASQFATLEVPQNALTIDVAQSPEAIVAEVRSSFSL